MLLFSRKSSRAFTLLWVMLVMGAMSTLATGLSVWVCIEAQRAQLRRSEVQARFAAQAVLRQVVGDLQWMLGPDTRVVERDKTGQYTVWDSGGWDSKKPEDYDGLQIGLLGMQKQSEAPMEEVPISDGKCVYLYRYSLTPGWDVEQAAKGLPVPKRVLADVRQGDLCQALDKMQNWKGSNALIWDDHRWPNVNFMGPTRGQVESFLVQPSKEIIVPQASVKKAEDDVIARPFAKNKYAGNARSQRPVQVARYLRPIKIELDCFLTAINVQELSGDNINLELQVVAAAKVTAINPYDNAMSGGVYFLELKNVLGWEQFFSIYVETPEYVKTTGGPFLFPAIAQGRWQWNLSCDLTESFLKSHMKSKSSPVSKPTEIETVSSDNVLSFPNMGNTGYITVKNCIWSLGTHKTDACQLELMDEISLNWHPNQVMLEKLTVGALIKQIQQSQVYLGSFSTEYADLEGLARIGRQVWASSNFGAAKYSQGKTRWALNDNFSTQALQIPSFAALPPKSVMDVIHWGEWNPYQWAEGMPFYAVRPPECKRTEYVWLAAERNDAQLIDIGWLMGEALLDKYYLSTQAGIDARSPGWADYGLNVNDYDLERWERHLKAFLSAGQAKKLAQACVDVLDERGRFMGIADFVNRRLVDSHQGDCGAFEAACERAGIPHSARLELIANLVPLLSAREDAWTIDIEVKIQNAGSENMQGYKKLRAWAQRSIDYVDATAGSAQPFSFLSDNLGRKWRVVAMQWL